MKKIKLLVLGATPGEINLINRAQSKGIYVIATDYHIDYSLSPAKDIADEAWDISWSDIDTLEVMCRENNVDGAIAGYSEIRVDSLIKLCERMNWPCYATDKQLEITRDKEKFKSECRKYNVPVIREYASIEDVKKYPVIVKPVDRAGSIGISIAKNKKELEDSYTYAMEKSISKKVIIEEYIEQSVNHVMKIDLYYGVIEGEICLLSSCDTINAKENAYDKVIQSAWLYPSKKEKCILDKVDIPIRNMIKGMNIQNGCIFYSGFYDHITGNISFFECGYRLEGGHQSTYVEERGPINYLDIFINSALGNCKNLKLNDVNKDVKAVTINLYAKKGEIQSIEGFESLKNIEECSIALKQSHVGEECYDNQAILNKLGMFTMTGNNARSLQQLVDKGYDTISILDTSNNDMIYDRIDTDIIKEWWN